MGLYLNTIVLEVHTASIFRTCQCSVLTIYKFSYISAFLTPKCYFLRVYSHMIRRVSIMAHSLFEFHSCDLDRLLSFTRPHCKGHRTRLSPMPNYPTRYLRWQPDGGRVVLYANRASWDLISANFPRGLANSVRPICWSNPCRVVLTSKRKTDSFYTRNRSDISSTPQNWF